MRTIDGISIIEWIGELEISVEIHDASSFRWRLECQIDREAPEKSIVMNSRTAAMTG